MNTELAKILKNNGIAVAATDTIYGILGSALNEDVVDRIYKLKGRDDDKKLITLIPSIESLTDFGVQLSEAEVQIVQKLWPGAVTIILQYSGEKAAAMGYLHRGTNESGFRLPAKESLRELLKETGPLVAPSANPQGAEPARTIDEAKAYFGDLVDYYEDDGEVYGEASTMIELKEGKITVIRQGAVSVL